MQMPSPTLSIVQPSRQSLTDGSGLVGQLVQKSGKLRKFSGVLLSRWLRLGQPQEGIHCVENQNWWDGWVGDNATTIPTFACLSL